MIKKTKLGKQDFKGPDKKHSNRWITTAVNADTKLVLLALLQLIVVVIDVAAILAVVTTHIRSSNSSKSSSFDSVRFSRGTLKRTTFKPYIILNFILNNNSILNFN